MRLFQRTRLHTSSPAMSEPGTNGADLEAATQRIGRELFEASRGHRAGLASGRFWSDQLMDWAMKDPAFKVQLFRFIDVFPVLRSPEEIHDHVLEYLTAPGVSAPPGLSMALKAGRLLKGTLAKTISSQVLAMAGKFIGGADPASAIATLRQLWSDRVAFSVDLLGEACVSDAEADAYRQRYLKLIETLVREVAGWSEQPTLETDHLGAIPRVNVSVKISSLCARIKPADFEGSLGLLTEALMPILRVAHEHNVFVSFDMEQYALKDLTIALFQRCCEQIDFPAGLALQAYLRSGEEDAARLIAWAKRLGRQVTVRLIKGAYWDYETIHAEQLGWPTPVWSRKSATDACFERMTAQLIEAMPRSAGEGGVKLALGSHNARSIAHGLALLEQHRLPGTAIELQMLHGMADELKAAAVARGLRVREYVPVGQMIPGMAYLVRRLLENTSNESWLRAGFASDASEAELLASPHERIEAGRPRADEPASGQPSIVSGSSVATLGATVVPGATGGLSASAPDGPPFLNEPPRDFSIASVRDAFNRSINHAAVPSVRIDATVQDASAAVGRAQAAFPAWRDTPAQQRSNLLIRAAAALRQRRDELAGIMIRQSDKTWPEADADVCEAIDFCEYYAYQAIALFEPHRLGRLIGEINTHWHQPRGVAAIISPWNFPLSICTGMTVAALVTGNTVIVKPAEQTPGIAQILCQILHDAGAAADVVQFLPGRGETVGAALVRDPRVAIIAFTGSKAVGLDILQAAAAAPAGQNFVKRVICEMGGKNAIIVDSSADLDEAVPAVRHSAFSYSGQKCSACSRVIVLDSIHDAFLARLVESTRSLQIGDPMNPATDVGPVIDAEASNKIRSYIEIGANEGHLELAMEPPLGLEERIGKPIIGPHIFSAIRPDHRLAQEEIFGPVLSVMRAKDFDEALAIANSTPYKLTGGVFSRTPSHLDRARSDFRVGDLYLNRGITGALVARQPFGGFGLSGTGIQAGGAEYLLQFVDSRTCSENAMRRGFAPFPPNPEP